MIVRQDTMGLSSGFKQYLLAEFPDAYAKPTDSVSGDITIVDAMVILHAFKPDKDSSLPSAHQLADKFYFMLWESPVGVLCFDDVNNTPRTKEKEWNERKRSTGACDPVALESLLEKHELPSDWDDFVSDRVGRQRLNTYLRDELVKRMRLSRGMASMQRLYIFNADETPLEVAWPPPAMGEHEAPYHDDALVVRSRPDWSAPLVGEGEMCCVRAALLLRDEQTQKVVIQTCDTDAVLIAMLNSFQGLFVQLSHYDRKQSSLVYALIDVHALVEAVQKRLRISVKDFCIVALSKGSDFVSQSVGGIADWKKYVDACCSHIKATSPAVASVTVSGSKRTRVDVGRVDAMLRSLETLNKRVCCKYETANHLKRLAWNTFYFAHAVSGDAAIAAQLNRLETFGWSERGGIMQTDDTPAHVRSTPTIEMNVHL